MLKLQHLVAACLALSMLRICHAGSAPTPPRVSFLEAGRCNLSGPLDVDACHLRVLRQEPMEGVLQPGEVRYVAYDHTQHSQGMSWKGYSWKAEIQNVDWTQAQAVMLVMGVARSTHALDACIANLTAAKPQTCNEDQVPYMSGTMADGSTLISYVYPSNETIPTNFTEGNKTWIENITATVIGWSRSNDKLKELAPPSFTNAPPTYGYVFFLGSLSNIPINFNFHASHVALPVVAPTPSMSSFLMMHVAMVYIAMLVAGFLILDV